MRRGLARDGSRGMCCVPRWVIIPTQTDTRWCMFPVLSNEATSQERIFKLAGKPLVQNALQGYNSTVFAYG